MVQIEFWDPFLKNPENSRFRLIGDVFVRRSTFQLTKLLKSEFPVITERSKVNFRQEIKSHSNIGYFIVTLFSQTRSESADHG